jgi:alkylated DNA nucleotide flippase Atl1
MVMVMERDEIVDIPENRVKYFGGHGKMLLPTPATVASVIERIPASKLITTDLLRQELGEQFDVEGVCPVTTQRALQALSNDEANPVAYWRVVNANGGLIARFPGGVEGHARHLREEGISISTSSDTPKVQDFKERLVSF